MTETENARPGYARALELFRSSDPSWAEIKSALAGEPEDGPEGNLRHMYLDRHARAHDAWDRIVEDVAVLQVRLADLVEDLDRLESSG